MKIKELKGHGEDLLTWLKKYNSGWINGKNIYRIKKKRKIKKIGRTKIFKEITFLQCRICKEWLPATTDYFHKASSNIIKLRHDCKMCISKRQERYRNSV